RAPDRAAGRGAHPRDPRYPDGPDSGPGGAAAPQVASQAVPRDARGDAPGRGGQRGLPHDRGAPRHLIVGIMLGEALLLLAGLLAGQPLLGALVAAAVVYLVLAYRHPNLAWILVWLAFPFSI